MEIVKGDTIKVYGIMNDFGSYKQFIGRVDIIRNGRTYTLESYKEPYIEKKDGKWYLDGKEYKFE
jgi:hypothetical protein